MQAAMLRKQTDLKVDGKGGPKEATDLVQYSCNGRVPLVVGSESTTPPSRPFNY